MRQLKHRWSALRRGINIGTRSDCDTHLQNLRFADDVIVVGKSKTEVVQMLEDLSNTSESVGLGVHFGKTFILSNCSVSSSVSICGHDVTVLDAQETTTYLGRALCLADWHDSEVKNRVSKAWAKFYSLRKVLCSRTYPVNQRMALFEQVVTATLLYGSSSWTMTATRLQTLSTTQRCMLRKIVGLLRRTDDGETYIEWMRRSTHVAEMLYSRSGGECWAKQQRRRYWRWAGHVARSLDGRWSSRLLYWHPSGSRRPGRPVKRWADDLDAFFKQQMGSKPGEWICHAVDRQGWKAFEEEFVQRVCFYGTS